MPHVFKKERESHSRGIVRQLVERISSVAWAHSSQSDDGLL